MKTGEKVFVQTRAHPGRKSWSRRWTVRVEGLLSDDVQGEVVRQDGREFIRAGEGVAGVRCGDVDGGGDDRGEEGRVRGKSGGSDQGGRLFQFQWCGVRRRGGRKGHLSFTGTTKGGIQKISQRV